MARSGDPTQIDARGAAAADEALFGGLDDAPEAVREAAREPANRVDRFVLLERLGRGSMGDVFKAWNVALAQWCALKRLRGTTTSVSRVAVQRFLREAQTAAALSHPNICRIYDVLSLDDGRLFIVMQYIDGGPLGTSPLSGSRCAEVFRQLALGLEHAHSKDVIHRDIKPGNIMLDTRGVPYLTDFGLAKSLEGSSTLTQAGTVVGSPAYMSPEQAEGLELDPRSDIYSLGATLYAILVGESPYLGARPLDVLVAVASGPPPRPSERAAGVPPELEAICLKAMGRPRERRYASAQEMADAFGALLEGAGPAPAAVPESGPRPVVRRSQPRTRRGGRAGTSRTVEAPRERGARPAWVVPAAAAAAVLLLTLGLAYGLRAGGRGGAPPKDGHEPATQGAPVERADPAPGPTRPAGLDVGLALLAHAEALLDREPVEHAAARAKLAEAVERLTPACEPPTPHVEAVVAVARARRLQFDLPGARAVLARLADRDPPSIEWLAERVRVGLEAYLQALLRCDQCETGPLRERARQLGQAVAADLDRIARRRPGLTQAERAAQAYGRWQLEDAVRYAEAAGDAGDLEPVLGRTLGDVMYMVANQSRGEPATQRRRQAVMYYGQVLLRHPGDYGARLMRAFTRAMIDRETGAEADARATLQRRPGDPQASSALGRALRSRVLRMPPPERMRALGELRLIHDAALRRDPGCYDNRVDRALVLISLGQVEPALADLTVASKINPGAYSAWMIQGMALHGAQRSAEALAPTDRAIEAAPDAPQCHLQRGVILMALARWAEARVSLQKALDLGYVNPVLVRRYLEIVASRGG